MNIISGEKFQMLCDYYIGFAGDSNFNPRFRTQASKFINIDNYDIENIKKMKIYNLFCYTHIIDGEKSGFDNNKCIMNFQNLIIILSNISTPYNIIFHNSDGCFKNEHKKLLELPNVKKIYSQNLLIEPEERIVPLPIAIANSMWPHGNLNIWKYILENNNLIHKPQHIFFNFNINTNSVSRTICYNIIKSKNIPNLPNTDYMSYLKILLSYKFAICPEGNGIDTHRFWECLYLKVIPICLKNYVTQYYSKLFPIVLLDDWNNIDENSLLLFYNNANWNNYHLLDYNNFYNEFFTR
jgi:hypothetical protein